MILLAIDPGRWTGWCVWQQEFGPLRVGLGQPPFNAFAFDRVVIERPKIYSASLMKGDPNDMITLALLAGLYWGQARTMNCEFVYPSDWKGQLNKVVSMNRTKKSLGKNRVKVESWLKSVPESLVHNVWDAIGIAIWADKFKTLHHASKVQETLDLTDGQNKWGVA